MGMYSLHSPNLETARKQPIASIVLSSIEGEGQLARAAAYIQEHVKRRSFTSDKFPCHSPKVPPDKPLDVVSKEMKAGKLCSLPVCHPEGLVESDRCSDERLIEAEEVSEVLVKRTCKSLIDKWKAVQDSVICFTVSQEALATPFRGLNVVKSDTMRTPIHSSKPFATPSLPLMTSISPAWGFPSSWSSLELDQD